MDIGNLILGLIVFLIGILGLGKSITSKIKNEDDSFGQNLKFTLSSIMLLIIALSLILREINKLF